MTREELTACATTRLASHLASEDWSALSDTRKAAALSTAIDDVIARVGSLSLPCNDGLSGNLVNAVAEQAIFLGLNYSAKSVHSAGAVVSSESVDGASISYVATADPADSGISARASMYISAIRGYLKGTARVYRG